MPFRIQLRHDTAANFSGVNPTLKSGEAAFATDTNNLRIGDGSTAYNSLSSIAGGGGGGGDITAVTAGTGLNGGGTTGAVTLNIDDTVIQTGDLNTKLQASSGINLAYIAGSNSLQIATSGSILANMTAVPANNSAAGSLGQVAFDSNHLYIAVGANSWKRIALSTF